MKKFLTLFGVVVIVLAMSTIVFANSDISKVKPSDYNVGIPYSYALQSNKPMVVLFYTDWCGYCLKFMPKYKMISNLYKNNYNFVMLNAENYANRALVNEVALTGYPTLYIIDPKYDNRVLLNNAIYMDISKMKIELDRYLRIRSLLDSK